jgi:hypothetical protein
MRYLFSVLLALVFTIQTSHADPARDLAAAVAETYGLSKWSEVNEIHFTFNAQLSDRTLSRTWTWKPQSHTITQHGPEGPMVSWTQKELASATEEIKTADAQFINDSYWLLFPFRLVWDKGTNLTLHPGEQPLPIGEGNARKLTVLYRHDVGYTPGDAYDLYIGKDNRILAWTFRKGNAPEPTRISTWEDYQDIGGLNLSLNHVGPDNFRVWFTDVTVK